MKIDHPALVTTLLLAIFGCVGALLAKIPAGTVTLCADGRQAHRGAEFKDTCAKGGTAGARVGALPDGTYFAPRTTRSGMPAVAVGGGPQVATPVIAMDLVNVRVDARSRRYYCPAGIGPGAPDGSETLPEFEANARGFVPFNGKPCN